MDKVGRDFIQKIPGFLAAIEEIKTRGFFGTVSAEVTVYDGKMNMMVIKGEGYLPDEEKDMCPSQSLVDPALVIQEARRIVEAGKNVTHCSVEINTKDWPRYDRGRDDVVGSKGSVTNFKFILAFK